MTMNDQQLLRYSRHILLPDVDIDGQEKLLAARVLIIGLGGLGSPVSMYLAASGVGHLLLADFDTVDLTNLQRQIAHTTDSVGLLKVESAAQTVRAINPDISITCVTDTLNAENLDALVQGVDVVVDCTDNFAIRFTINRACVLHKIPLVSGAAIQMDGQIAVFDSRNSQSPCYRCLYETTDDDRTCAANGVLAPVVGIVGTHQALEVMRVIVGFGDDQAGMVKLFDARSAQWRSLKLPKDPACPVCNAAVIS